MNTEILSTQVIYALQVVNICSLNERERRRSVAKGRKKNGENFGIVRFTEKVNDKKENMEKLGVVHLRGKHERKCIFNGSVTVFVICLMFITRACYKMGEVCNSRDSALDDFVKLTSSNRALFSNTSNLIDNFDEKCL